MVALGTVISRAAMFFKVMGGCSFRYAAGYSFKVISRAAMFLVGTGFIALQVG